MRAGGHVSGGRYMGLVLSLLVELMAGLYLLTSDTDLSLPGNSLHWQGLLVYSVVNVVVLLFVFIGPWKATNLFAGIWGVIGVAAIIGDAASNLALSSFYGGVPYSGWNYLFGFGKIQGSGSVFSTSLFVTVLLVFSAVTAIIGFGNLMAIHIAANGRG